MPEHNLIAPLHPGEVLAEDFMKPVGLSMNALAMEIRVPASLYDCVDAGGGNAWHHSGYGLTPWPIFLHHQRILAKNSPPRS